VISVQARFEPRLHRKYPHDFVLLETFPVRSN
jgi:hypothetical protein